jgi:hypothetical protein
MSKILELIRGLKFEKKNSEETVTVPVNEYTNLNFDTIELGMDVSTTYTNIVWSNATGEIQPLIIFPPSNCVLGTAIVSTSSLAHSGINSQTST